VLTSWYFNLFMFGLVFACGLWTAIVAHVLYELCVYWTRGITNDTKTLGDVGAIAIDDSGYLYLSRHEH